MGRTDSTTTHASPSEHSCRPNGHLCSPTSGYPPGPSLPDNRLSNVQGEGKRNETKKGGIKVVVFVSFLFLPYVGGRELEFPRPRCSTTRTPSSRTSPRGATAAGASPTKEDVKRCFMLDFDRQVRGTPWV